MTAKDSFPKWRNATLALPESLGFSFLWIRLLWPLATSRYRLTICNQPVVLATARASHSPDLRGRVQGVFPGEQHEHDGGGVERPRVRDEGVPDVGHEDPGLGGRDAAAAGRPHRQDPGHARIQVPVPRRRSPQKSKYFVWISTPFDDTGLFRHMVRTQAMRG